MAVHSVKECIKEDIFADYLGRKGWEVVNMLMAEYDYETDIEVHSQEAEARGEAKGRLEGRTEGRIIGRDEGRIEVYYTEMHLSVETIAEKLSMKKEAARKILAERGILKEEMPV